MEMEIHPTQFMEPPVSYQPENEGFWDWMVTCRRALGKQMVLKLTEDACNWGIFFFFFF
jgi:hypothetical protein